MHRSLLRRPLVAPLIALVALSIALLLIAGHPRLGIDSMWHLQWGHELLTGEKPSYVQPDAPTAHPLLISIAAVASILGRGFSYWLMVGLNVIAFAATLVLLVEIGRRTFSLAAGVAAALVIGLSPELIHDAASGVQDMLFLAIVLGAVLIACSERSDMLVMGVLAVAGLVRPEAWLLSGAYWLWKTPRHPWKVRAQLAALAAIAPVLWLWSDWLITGSPTFSLTHTQEGARELERVIGLHNVPGQAVSGLQHLLGRPALAGALAGFVVALLVRKRRATPVLGLAVVGGVTFVAIGVANLSLLDRYLLLPSVALALCFGYLFTVARDRWRTVLGALAVVAGAGALVGVPDRVSDIRHSRAEFARSSAVIAALRSLAQQRGVESLLAACPTVYVRDRRPRALVAYLLGRESQTVLSALRDAPRPDGLFLTVTPDVARGRDVAFFPAHAERPPAQRPASYRVEYRNDEWELSAGPRCSAGDGLRAAP